MRNKWIFFFLCFSILLAGRADALFKNVASQKVTVYAYDTTAEAAETGDASNIVAQISLDGAASVAISDTNPTELDATDHPGVYVFDLATTETNANLLVISAVSSTTAIWIEPISIYTRAAVQDANITQISGDTTAADNLESQYDTTGLNGDTFPATQAQVAGIANTGAAINKVASSATITFGTQTNTYTATQALDGTYHVIEPELDTTYKTDLYYEFDIGTRGVPVSATFSGRLYDPPVTNDDITIQAYDYVAVDWVTVGSLDGVNSSVDSVKTVILFTTNMTAANSGIVRLRFVNTDLSSDTDLYLDLLYCSYSVVGSVTGYANGAIWYDSAGNPGAIVDVNGVADNPVSVWSDALSLSASTGLTSFRVINGSSITLTGNSDNFTIAGNGWALNLNGQSIEGLYVYGSLVTGIGTATVSRPVFDHCSIGAITLPPSILGTCGIGRDSGTFTAGSAGQYVFDECFSLVPGSGSPTFDFSGVSASTGINNRGWKGGATYTLDSGGNCTLSQEVLVGGGQSITTGGGDVELRGIFRSATITSSGSGTTQIVGVAGPVTINGTGGTINVYGVSSSITDNSSGTTINYETVESEDVQGLVAEIGTAVALDGGAATLGGMLTKMADDNGGADFDATDDSLTEFRDSVSTEDELIARGFATTTTVNTAHAATDAGVAVVDANVDTLLARLTAARAGYLDNLSAGAVALASVATEARLAELDAANIPADVDALLSRLTAVRAGYLDNLSAGAVALASGVNVTQWNGTNVATPSVAGVPEVDITHITGNAGAASSLKSLTDLIVDSGTAQGPGADNNQIQLDAGSPSVSDIYDPSMILLSDGTGAGQSRRIIEYNGTTKVAIVSRTWKTTPDATTDYVILADPGGMSVNEGLAQSGGASTITLNTLASSVNDEYNCQTVFIVSGAGEDQSRIVIDYNGTTKVATVDRAWGTQPDGTSGYMMLPIGTNNTNIAAILADTTRVDAMIEDDSGDQYTAKSLSQAPGGGGGGTATLEKQEEILANIDDVPTSTTLDLMSHTPTAGGVNTVEDILIQIFSMAQGNMVKSGNTYTWYDDDNTTALFSFTVGSSGRTRN
jgi:hypothetical protein